MNIIIWGNKASGKTLLADMLAKHYQEQGQIAQVIDEGKYFSPSWKVAEFMRRQSERILERTLHDPIHHTIVTTQASPNMIHRFYDAQDIYDPDMIVESLFDYYYHTLNKTNKGQLIALEEHSQNYIKIDDEVMPRKRRRQGEL